MKRRTRSGNRDGKILAKIRWIGLSLTAEGWILLFPQVPELEETLKDEKPEDAKNEGGNWIFSPRIYETVAKKLCEQRIRLLPKECKYFETILKKECPIKNSLPERILNILYKFQVEAVEKALGLNGRVVLGDTSGLGKKYQALSIAFHFLGEGPILIVCDKISAENWKRVSKAILDFEVPFVQKISEVEDGSFIISHLFLMHHYKKLKSLKFSSVIVDDAHLACKKTTYLEECHTKFLKDMAHIILVSPAMSNLKILDWFVVFRHIFLKEILFCTTYKKRYEANKEEFQYLKNKVSVIRDKEEVAGSLSLRSETAQEGSRARHRRVTILRAVCTQSIPNPRKRCKAESALKCKKVCLYIKHFLSRNSKVIVIVRFYKTLRKIAKYFSNTNIAMIYGKSSEEEILELCRFQEDDCQMAILTYKKLKFFPVIGKGSVIVADVHPDTANINAAENSSEDKLLDLHYLISKGGLEEEIWHKIQESIKN